MPWLETSPVLERQRFVKDVESGHWTMSELCVRYGVSRKTGYKWVDRYEVIGPRGLEDRSHRPRVCPTATPLPVSSNCSVFGALSSELGAKKLLSVLRKRAVTALGKGSAA